MGKKNKNKNQLSFITTLSFDSENPELQGTEDWYNLPVLKDFPVPSSLCIYPQSLMAM